MEAREGNECGEILRKWRKKRRYSQLQLSVEAGVSSKHISFIETGRSVPSKKMILHIQNFLELPRAELNQVLRSAGYAPEYQQFSSQHEELIKPIYHAIDRIIEQQMPYPAFVLDRHWNVVRANPAMQNLLSDIGLEKHSNIIEALTDPEFDRTFITNYYEVINLLTYRVKSENAHNGDDKNLINLENQLTTIVQLNPIENINNSVVLDTKFNIHGQHLNLFSTITELGAVQDVSIGCFKIEQMFPVDDETKEYFSLGKSVR